MKEHYTTLGLEEPTSHAAVIAAYQKKVREEGVDKGNLKRAFKNIFESLLLPEEQNLIINMFDRGTHQMLWDTYLAYIGGEEDAFQACIKDDRHSDTIYVLMRVFNVSLVEMKHPSLKTEVRVLTTLYQHHPDKLRALRDADAITLFKALPEDTDKKKCIEKFFFLQKLALVKEESVPHEYRKQALNTLESDVSFSHLLEKGTLTLADYITLKGTEHRHWRLHVASACKKDITQLGVLTVEQLKIFLEKKPDFKSFSLAHISPEKRADLLLVKYAVRDSGLGELLLTTGPTANQVVNDFYRESGKLALEEATEAEKSNVALVRLLCQLQHSITVQGRTCHVAYQLDYAAPSVVKAMINVGDFYSFDAIPGKYAEDPDMMLYALEKGKAQEDVIIARIKKRQLFLRSLSFQQKTNPQLVALFCKANGLLELNEVTDRDVIRQAILQGRLSLENGTETEKGDCNIVGHFVYACGPAQYQYATPECIRQSREYFMAWSFPRPANVSPLLYANPFAQAYMIREEGLTYKQLDETEKSDANLLLVLYQVHGPQALLFFPPEMAEGLIKNNKLKLDNKDINQEPLAKLFYQAGQLPFETVPEAMQKKWVIEGSVVKQDASKTPFGRAYLEKKEIADYRHYLANNGNGRDHFFTRFVATKPKVEDKGDVLKRKLLEGFEQAMQKQPTVKALDTWVKEVKESDIDYQILKKGQGLATRMFGLDTSSVKAFEAMVALRRTALEADTVLASPAPCV